MDNPGKYFSRKQVYGISVQVIVDKRKRVLWRYIGEMGSSHDSQVFHESKLGKFLELHRAIMQDMGIYIVGDSAYALRNYLLCPYDYAGVGSPEDAFNYYLSSCRIYVECCFGEVDRRWGILWRPIEGMLFKKKIVVDACLRLHNYIVDEIEASCESDDEENFTEEETIEILNEANAEMGMVHSNPFERVFASLDSDGGVGINETSPQSPNEMELRGLGKEVRDKLRDELWSEGFRRPPNKD